MRLIVAVGCDGKNCLLAAGDDVREHFDIETIGFIDQPKKSGVYLVEVSETEPNNNVFRYKGTFKLLYHPEILAQD
jgi:hypothetical protein